MKRIRVVEQDISTFSGQGKEGLKNMLLSMSNLWESLWFCKSLVRIHWPN